MSLEPTTNFRDSNGVDLGSKLVTKDYLISVYPSIGEQIGIPPELWVWGANSNAQLGTNDQTNRSIPVTTFAGGTNWKQVSAGNNSTTAIKTDGTLWSWGTRLTNASFGGSSSTLQRTPIQFFNESNWKTITSDQSFYAIKTDGTLWTWGQGFDGTLGNNSHGSVTPTTTIVGGNNWKQVSASSEHVAAIKTDGTLWTWGIGEFGQLGRIPPTKIISTPITTFAGGAVWADTSTGEPDELYTISTSSVRALAIKTDGTLWTWGNASSVLGLGIDNSLKYTPVTTFAGGSDWKQVSTGAYATAIKTDGSLWVWGSQASGRPPSGVTTTSIFSTPVTTFAGGTNWADTATGEPNELYTISTSGSFGFFAAIKTDGTLWTWGQDISAQLGTNDTLDKFTPVTTFAGGTNWKQVSAGQSTMGAIKTDGTLWVWGSSGSGQLGNANITARSTPVTTFAGGTDWKQVSVNTLDNGSVSVAIKTNGTLWTWGNGASNQLGNNSKTNTSTPITTFAGGTNWKQVSVGEQIVSAIKTDGTLWTWGNKAFMGIVFPTLYSTPVTTFAGGTNWADTATTEPEDLYTLSAGTNHTAAIKTDGTLWTWGNGINGQLGINTSSNRSTPTTTFAGGTNWKQVSAGSNHTSAIKTDGTLWVWGNGNNGRLGNFSTINRVTPITTFAGGTNWKQVSCAGYYTVATKTDGTLWTWGTGTTGQLGNFAATNRSTPVTTFAGGTDWKQTSAGTNHTAAIKTDGTLWTWGQGTNGRLGNDAISTRSTPVTTFAGGTDWKQVSAGYRHTAAIKTDGTLWTWGYGSNGQLGTNDTTARFTPITTFAGGTNWKQVSAGITHTVAIKTDGTLWVWGNGNNGRLGTNDITDRSTPVTTFAGGTNWKQVSAGNFHTIALKDDGVNKELFVFGSNSIHQLGFDIDTNVPFNVLPTTTDWKQVSAGGQHTAAVKTDGTLWTWGSGTNGRLGNFATTNSSTPVTTFAGGTNWKQVGCSGHTAAIKTDGTLWTWGSGAGGQLGNANLTNISTPVTTFAGGTNWKQVSAGGSQTIALKDDGVNKEIFVFGNNTFTFLGVEVNDLRFPTRLKELNWKQVSAGTAHIAAIKTDGTLWTWGNGNNGQLGNNLTFLRSTPVTTFAGGTDWKQVSSGFSHTAAIKTDGTLWTWGGGTNGRLGINDGTDRSTPVTTFAGGTDWKQVSTGSYTSAIKTDGTLWTWGVGTDGQLGTNDLTTRSTPVTTFAGGTNWKQVSVGTDYTAAVKTDGTLWTWGYGSNGQLGTNDTTARFTPITTFAGGTNWTQVFVSHQGSTTIALRGSGTSKELFVFGDNTLMTANNNSTRKFEYIPTTTFAGGTNWKQVSVGTDYTAAVKTDGTLWTWGDNYYGELGTNNSSIIFTPVTTFAGGTNWKQVSAGSTHTAAIKTDGTLWSWGKPYQGSLGLLNFINKKSRFTPITTFAGGTNWADTANDLPEELYTISAADGYNNFCTMAIKTDGTLWTWGNGYTYSLGINFSTAATTPVTTFAGGTNWKQVSTSAFSSSAIKTDGTLWVWGSNVNASLGTNADSPLYIQTPITTFAGGTNWKQVSIGYASTGAIKTDGTLWMWGYNINGQLGINDQTQRLTPVTTFAGGTDWKQISCAGYLSTAIKTDGTLWTWGANFYGDAGINSFDRPITPVTTFAGGTNWKQVSMSPAGFVGAIKTDGTLWMWGTNRSGELGINNFGFAEISTPVTTFVGGTDWKQVSAGGPHGDTGSGFTAAIKTDGTLWTWGYGYYGQLGTNDTLDRLTPVTTFAGGTNWKQVSAGGFNTVALKDDGVNKELFVFGKTKLLGINYSFGINTPVTTFAGGTDWKQVSVGGDHTAAIKTDGTLWAWGSGTSGKLGINDQTRRLTPVTTFAGGTNWKQVSSIGFHVAAIRSVDF